MRREYILVFEFPDTETGKNIAKVGSEIEDIMNEKFPEIYQDVMWKATL